jgi:four helix bundle protein
MLVCWGDIGRYKMTSFEELECYKYGRKLRIEISIFCKTLPRYEEYRLKDQIIRSSRSVTENLAEGYGRHHHQENIQFCRISRGSLTEAMEQLNIALDEDYLSKEKYDDLRELTDTTLKLLNGYIRYLKTCSSNGVPAINQQPTTSNRQP